jgi:hypothetical protein
MEDEETPFDLFRELVRAPKTFGAATRIAKKNRASQSGGDRRARGIVDTHICRFAETFSSCLCQAGNQNFKIQRSICKPNIACNSDNKS